MVERCEDLDVLPLHIITNTEGQNNTCVSCQDETCFNNYSLTEFKVQYKHVAQCSCWLTQELVACYKWVVQSQMRFIHSRTSVSQSFLSLQSGTWPFTTLTSRETLQNMIKMIISDLIVYLGVLCVIEVKVILFGWFNSKCPVRSRYTLWMNVAICAPFECYKRPKYSLTGEFNQKFNDQITSHSKKCQFCQLLNRHCHCS